MAYASNTDVASLINISFSDPSTTEIDAWCNQFSARIDAILTRNGYATIPATGANDLLLFKGVVTMGVAGLMVWPAAFTGNEEPPKVAAWRKTWEDFLTDLKKGDIRLEDQAPESSIGVSFPATYGYND